MAWISRTLSWTSCRVDFGLPRVMVVARERDTLTVGRPGGQPIVTFQLRQAELVRTVGIHDPELGAATEDPLEDDA